MQNNQDVIFSQMQSNHLQQEKDNDKLTSMMLSLQKQEANNYKDLSHNIPTDINTNIGGKLNEQFGAVAQTHDEMGISLQNIIRQQMMISKALQSLASQVDSIPGYVPPTVADKEIQEVPE